MATAVFDVDAIGLLRIVNNLNHSLDIVKSLTLRPFMVDMPKAQYIDD